MLNRLNRTYQEDLDKVLQTIDLSPLRGKTVLVTGASGLIGSCFVDLLIRYNALYSAESAKKNEIPLKINIVVCGRNAAKLGNVFNCYFPYMYGPEFLEYDLTTGVPNINADYIIHCAAPTQPSDFKYNPSKVIFSIINSTKNILELAQEKKSTVIYLSSCEVYGNVQKGAVSEDDCGDIDLTSYRSSYIEAKRTAEVLCHCYADSEKHVDVRILRMGKVFGPTFSDVDNRVAAQFFRAVTTDMDGVVLRTRGKQTYTFTYVINAVYAMLLTLLNGMSRDVYNVASYDSTMSVFDFGQEVSNLVGKQVAIEESPVDLGYSKNSCVLDGWRIWKELGYTEVVDTRTGIRNTFEALNGRYISNPS